MPFRGMFSGVMVSTMESELEGRVKISNGPDIKSVCNLFTIAVRPTGICSRRLKTAQDI